MKKVLFAAVAVFGFTMANAQEQENGKGFSAGDTFITGTVSFSNTKMGDDKANQFAVSPSLGYFFSDYVAAGVQLRYLGSKYDTTFEGLASETTNTSFGAGIFGRYYFNPASDFQIFGQLGAMYNTNKSETDAGAESKSSGFNVALAPGFNYFVSDHFALEATFGVLGYSTYKPDGAGEDRNSFNIGLDMSSINFGLLYKF